jgi:2-polyprenyl-3-methyl-5-hydroxy-6-metoxy-1,4-benzoquinol methylase
MNDLEVEPADKCLLCGDAGTLLYDHLTDRLFGSLGEWRLVRCPHDGLVWLNPRPARQEISKIYSKYYTHSVSDSSNGHSQSIRSELRVAICAAMAGAENRQRWHWKAIGKIATIFPPTRELGRMGARCLTQKQKGKLLDVGCGDGRFLNLMRSFGWDVRGVEPDAEAARIARDVYNLTVDCGTLDDIRIPPSSVDVVTLHHVIEHAPNPIELLQHCRRILTSSGLLVLVTPNLNSIGHRMFCRNWRDLDPPRHFYLFNSRTLSECVIRSGFGILSRRTSGRWAYEIGKFSRALSSNHVSIAAPRMYDKVAGLGFQLAESALKAFQPGSGEELVLLARPALAT